LKLCPTCGAEYPANERFCPRDGTALRAQGAAGNDLVGSIIAERYHVIKKLGEGGMGQVYLAEHVKMGRKSAVKVMNPGMVHDADAISRFNREASNASRINHPNVAGIYDFGETPEGLIYLAMEFIEGEALTDIVKSHGALPPARAANITRQAAEGLTVAHEMGIVHRDLKPDNIMIAKNRDGSDCVKVVDFGIAKAANAENQKVTRTGMVVGTPEYMSPEQLAGDKLDGKSDIYSLALVAFNMLTGKLPFPSETVQESMIMRLTDKPKPLFEMNPGVTWPAGVQAVMDRALERDAKLRYQSASEFGQALWTAIAEMPRSEVAEGGTLVMAPVPPTRVGGAAPAAPAPLAAPASAPVAKSRTPMLVGGGLVAAAVVAGVLFMRPPRATPAATVPSGGVTSNTAPPGAAIPTSAQGPAPAPQMVPGARPAAGTNGSGTAANGGGGDRTPASPKSESADAAAAGPGIAEQMKAIDRMAESEATAQRALDEATAISPKLTTQQQKVYLAIIRAQAYGTLGQDARSCEALKSVVSSARGTGYESTLGGMLQSCP
jgi:serine/threonine-protein kinase